MLATILNTPMFVKCWQQHSTLTSAAAQRRRQDANPSLGPNVLRPGSRKMFTQPSTQAEENNQADHQIFHFPEYYYRTQQIEGIPGTLYWKVLWEFDYL
jgi:hypothetical protein